MGGGCRWASPATTGTPTPSAAASQSSEPHSAPCGSYCHGFWGLVSENSREVWLVGIGGQDDAVRGLGGALKDNHKVTALPMHTSLDRITALMPTPLSHPLEG